MKRLEELTQDFKTSRPIFRLTLDRDGSTISVNVSHPVYRYRPEPEEGDALSKLVCDHYEECFDIHDGKFLIDEHRIANNAMEGIRGSMVKFIEKNLEMRNPRQSKLYRWAYRNMPNNNEFNDALILVYKYLDSFCDNNLKSNNLNHVNNAIALLTAMMEKYE